MKKPTVDDLHLHIVLSSLTAAAKGWAWVTKSINRDKDASESAVWVYRPESGLQRVTADGYGPAWSADGSELAFLRSIDGPQIFIQRPESEDATQVSHLASGVSSIEQWDSPRSRFLVRVVVQPDAPDDSPRRINYLPYKQDGLGVVQGQSIQLHCVDAESGEAARIDCGEGDVLEAKWSPDGGTVAYIQRRAGAQRHRMDLWIKRDGEPARQVTETLVSLSGLSWAPDGARIAVAASEIEGDSVSYLHVVEPDSGRVDEIGHLEMTIPSAIHWDDASARLIVTEAHRGLQHIVTVDLQGDMAVLWEKPDSQVFEMATAGERIGFFAAGISDGPEFFLRSADGGEVTRISSFNAWREDRPRLPATKRMFDVPDGEGGREQIEAWLLTPKGDGPFPLLLDMHGGPHSMVTFEFERYVHWAPLIDRGWAILALNAVGSCSYGDTFASRICGRWGELDLPQWQAAVKCLQDEGRASQQVACFGHSYGGYLSAWALSHDMPLMCGIVSGGVINLESHTGTSDSGYYVSPYAMCGELVDVRERYRALSPISHVERIRAPVLLLQGQDDERCPVGQAEELLAALVRRDDVKVEMVLFPGASHHVSSTGRPSHRVEYYESLISWLEDARNRESEGKTDLGTTDEQAREASDLSHA